MGFLTLKEHYAQRFGCKVYKLAIDAGFTCPNRDGTVGERGCIFCDGSGAFAESGHNIRQQLEQAKARVQAKNKGGKFIAYFQAFTNTYGPVEKLRSMYLEALEAEDVVGIAIGTRPDCLPEPVMDLLAEINQQKPVYVELGLQTVHPQTVAYIRRGYDTHVYMEAVDKLKAIGVHVVTHIILGLPGETPEMMRQTTRQAVLAGTDGVKFHLLHVLKGTDLERDYLAGKFTCLSLEAYAEILKSCIDLLPPHVVVHRITGDGAKKDLVAPAWSADKKRVMNFLMKYLEVL